MKSILFSLTLVFTALACFAQDYYGNNRKQWLQKAEQYKPKLIITEEKAAESSGYCTRHTIVSEIQSSRCQSYRLFILYAFQTEKRDYD